MVCERNCFDSCTHEESHISVMSTVKVSIVTKPKKQKLNTKGRTEAECFGPNDIIIHILWIGYFLKSQGYKSFRSVMAKDNKSAILLRKKRIFSSIKSAKHINVRYYFINIELKKAS